MKYIIDHDLHIHSCLSACSGNPAQTPAAILNYARANGFKHICLTDHFLCIKWYIYNRIMIKFNISVLQNLRHYQ